MNALLIAPQWIGDAVMTQPLLRGLQARGERVTVAAVPWVAPVYRVMPQVAEVIELPFARGGLQWRARKAFAQTLRHRSGGVFDVAYVCPNSWKSALIPWWAGIPRRVGYHGEARFGLLNQRLANPPKNDRPPMVAWYAALAGLSGEGMRPVLQIEAAQVAQTLAQPEWQAWHLQAQSYYVFAPGAEYGPAKRWPAAHFAALAQRLDAPVVLLGSGKEAALCAEIATLAGAKAASRCLNLAGRTALAQAFAFIAGAKAVVSNDSGLMHVAAALGVPQVALFGSSSPLHTPPLNPQAHVLWLKNDRAYQPPLHCAPCFARTCPLGHTRCLNDITPAQVQAQLIDVLSGTVA